MITRPLILRDPDAPAVGGGAPPVKPDTSPAPASAAPTTPDSAPATPSADDANLFAAVDAAVSKVESSLGDERPPKPAGGDVKPASAAPAASPKPAASPGTPAVEPEPKTPKELRESRERIKAELEEKNKSYAALEAKIKEYEAKGKDVTSLTALLDSKEKRINELEAEKRALKQEASPNFKKQYDEPFNRAARYAKRVVDGMMRADGTKANYETDFVPLFRMGYNEALTKAQETFGDAPGIAIMQRIGELQQLDFVREEAFEEEKKDWQEKAREREGALVEQKQKVKGFFETVTNDLRKSVEVYRIPPEDKEAEALRQQSQSIVNGVLKCMESGQWDKQAFVNLSHVCLRAEMLAPAMLMNRRKDAKIAALEKQVADLKPKPPGEGEAHPGGTEKTTPGEFSSDQWAADAKRAVEAAS